MSDLELDAIRARAEAATPGPWAVVCEEHEPEPYVVTAYGGSFFIASMHTHGPRYVHEVPACAEFIAHARTDVPALLAEVDRLRQLVASAEVAP